MCCHKIDGLPVVENKKLVGILSISYILDAFPEIMATNRPGTRLEAIFLGLFVKRFESILRSAGNLRVWLSF